MRAPLELQTCDPYSARARMHRWLVGSGAWLRKSLWCGCGGTMRGRGLLGGSAEAHGATSDVLAALYVPAEQVAQPELQEESQELPLV